MRELKVDCQWFNAIGDNYQLIINCVALKTGPLSPLNNVTWVHSFISSAKKKAQRNEYIKFAFCKNGDHLCYCDKY